MQVEKTPTQGMATTVAALEDILTFFDMTNKYKSPAGGIEDKEGDDNGEEATTIEPCLRMHKSNVSIDCAVITQHKLMTGLDVTRC